MSQTTRSPKESLSNTTIFVDNGVVVKRGDAVEGTTTKPKFSVVKVDLAQVDNLPDGYVHINDFVAEAESDRAEKAGLADARRWVAKTLYKGEKTLRAMRLSQGYSQARLANAIGSTQAQIARVENGDVDVQVSTLTRIANALRLSPGKVFEAYMNTRQAAGAVQE